MEYTDGDYLFAQDRPATDEPAQDTPITAIDPDIPVTVEPVEPVAVSRIIPARARPDLRPVLAEQAISYAGEGDGGTYEYAPPPGSVLPGGGELVTFDRTAWLAECRARLTGYSVSERARAMAALRDLGLDGVPLDNADGADECERYLNAYVARAQTLPAPTTTMPGRQYMLVPVTVPATSPTARQVSGPGGGNSGEIVEVAPRD